MSCASLLFLKCIPAFINFSSLIQIYWKYLKQCVICDNWKPWKKLWLFSSPSNEKTKIAYDECSCISICLIVSGNWRFCYVTALIQNHDFKMLQHTSQKISPHPPNSKATNKKTLPIWLFFFMIKNDWIIIL